MLVGCWDRQSGYRDWSLMMEIGPFQPRDFSSRRLCRAHALPVLALVLGLYVNHSSHGILSRIHCVGGGGSSIAVLENLRFLLIKAYINFKRFENLHLK